MKNSIRRSTGIVLSLLVVGCSGGSFVPDASANHQMANAGGGAFTAGASGGYTFLDCTSSANGHFKFRGGGHGSYLHYFVESGRMKGLRSGSRCVWSGSATLISDRHHKKDSVTFSLGLNGSRYHSPCGDAVGYVVKRGTGKFAHASGYGTVTFYCSDTYLDAWSGTLNF